MEVRITKEDLKIIESLKLHDYSYINKPFILYTGLYLIIANLALYLILFFNNKLLNVNWYKFIQPSILTILFLGFIFIVEKKAFKNKIIYKRYRYLLNDFKISVDDESKTLILNSNKVNIKVLITRTNIKINEEFIILSTDGEIIGMIPIAKINGEKEDRELIKLLNKYIEEV